MVLGLNLKSVQGNGWSAISRWNLNKVDTPSTVRAGDHFNVQLSGTYTEVGHNGGDAFGMVIYWGFDNKFTNGGSGTTEAAYIWSLGDCCPSNNSQCYCPGSSGSWSFAMDVQARTPSPNEYDSNGQYAWNLNALPLDPFSDIIECPTQTNCFAANGFGFTVTIIKPDADPYLKVFGVGPEDYQTMTALTSPFKVNVMERFLAAPMIEYSVPAGSTLTVSLRNDPAFYTKQQAARLQPDGWVPIITQNFQTATDFSGPMGPFTEVAPSHAMASWIWSFKFEVKTSDNRQASDDSHGFNLAVTEPQSPWAAFDHDQSALSYVQPGHNLLVTMVGNYVFPGRILEASRLRSV